MQYKFPYFQDRPHIPIVLKYEKKRVRFLPLLDSGADFSIFNKQDAFRLDLDWNKGKDKKFINADGSFFWCKNFFLDIEIEDFKFKSNFYFLDSEEYSTQLLDRKGIFENFLIMINEREKYVQFSV